MYFFNKCVWNSYTRFALSSSSIYTQHEQQRAEQAHHSSGVLPGTLVFFLLIKKTAASIDTDTERFTKESYYDIWYQPTYIYVYIICIYMLQYLITQYLLNCYIYVHSSRDRHSIHSSSIWFFIKKRLYLWYFLKMIWAYVL